MHSIDSRTTSLKTKFRIEFHFWRLMLMDAGIDARVFKESPWKSIITRDSQTYYQVIINIFKYSSIICMKIFVYNFIYACIDIILST